MDAIRTVVLKNGTEEAESLVLTVMTALHHLLKNEPLTLVDAVEMARTGQPQPYSAARLEAVGLTQGGVMHRSVANIIISASLGTGFDLQLTNPLTGA